ncbi:DHA2 family efflux MFS transporter permease subunit [Plantibacter sp. YIM 135347]|uniref:DHA2 family efflux MFS transporter permease subunit n=1 Tax=Plantibacter sp. YIM 135347 TaxID=3423919 RepID=UPI003D339E36
MTRRSAPVWLAILATSLPMFMATLDNLVVTNALPVLHEELGAGVDQLQWIINAYTLSFATFMLLAVTLGDRFGRRRTFQIGITIFVLSSAAAALSTDPLLLIIARAAQGLGAAALLPLSLPLLIGAVPDRLRTLAIGVWGGVSGLGVALGPVIGGAIIDGWNWQMIFWINVPLGIIAIPLVWFGLGESFGAKVRPDVIGTGLAGLAVFGIVYGVVRGNDAGWTSPEVLIALIGSAVLLVAFVVRQRVASAPLLPLRLFADRSFSVANVVGFAFSFGAFGSTFILIQFLQIVQGKTPLEAGLMTLPWTGLPMIIAPLAGLVAPRVGTRALIVAGLLSTAAGLGWLAFSMTPDAAFATMLPGFLLAGFGMGLTFAPSATAVLANVTAHDRAKASGTNSTLREIGVALGIAVLAAVFTGAGGQLTPTGYVDAAIPAVFVGAAAVLLAAIVAVFLPAGRRPPEVTAPSSDTDPADAADVGLAEASSLAPVPAP